MSEQSPTIFLSAAEASGDAHGAALIRAMKCLVPDARFVGVGGPEMIAAGCEPALADLPDLTRHASMLTGPILRAGFYYRAIRRLSKVIRSIRPDVHVPVDSPALNWHLAAAAKKADAKVVYYIAPQVWAWAPWRIKKILRLTDHVACILPFEEDWFRSRGVRATYVGHPLFDSLPKRPDPLSDLIGAWSDGQWRVALLAGSRPGEIRQHTAALAATAKAIQNRWPKARCTFAAGNDQAAWGIRRILAAGGFQIPIVTGQTNDILAQSHFAVTVSGTITLQVAHPGVPMVIVYKTGRLLYHLLGRWLIRTPHLSLVNILSSHAGEGTSGIPGIPGISAKKIVPELMPWHGSVEELTSTVLEVMEDLGGLLEMRDRLLEVARPLEPPPGHTASDNVAKLILDVMAGRQPSQSSSYVV